MYASIAMALYHTQDNVEQTIRNFTPDQQYPEYIEVQKRAIEILKKEQEHEN